MHADAGGEPGLVANYRFEEGAGTAIQQPRFSRAPPISAWAMPTISRWGNTDLINFSDVLTANTTDLEDTGISASYDSANGRLTLTKAEGGTAEDSSACCAALSFGNSSDAPDPALRTLIASTENSQGVLSQQDTNTFSINRSNDAISFRGIETLNYSENEAAKAIVPAGEIVDVDRSIHFGSGFIKAEFIAGSEASDQLTILESGGISVDGNTVSFTLNDDSTVVIGSIDGALNGINNTALQVNLNNNATLAASRALLRAFAYHNTSDDPSSGIADADNNRSIRITVNDGGSTSGVDPISQQDAALEGSTDVTVAFTSINDAPELSFTASGTWTESNSGTADPLLFLSNVVASDIDGEHYNNGYARIDLTPVHHRIQLSIATGNGVETSGSSILYNGAEIGSIDATDNGDGRALKLNFGNAVTRVVDDALIAMLARR